MARYLSTLGLWLILALGLVAAATYQGLGLLNHDTSYLLIATERWLDGATLYRDIMEINPPLIFYLTVPAIVLAGALNISSSAAFIVLIAIASALSLAWCWSLLSRVPALRPSVRYYIVIASLAALVFIPSVEFGQREHLFFILALPYLMQQIFSSSGLSTSRTENAALGAVAVFGIALKPFFLLPVLAVTYMRCRQAGRLKPAFDPGNIAIAVGCVAYVLFVAAVHPEYFSIILPMGAVIYGAIGFAPPQVVPDTIVPLLLILAIATVEDASSALRNAFTFLAATLAGLLGIYILQFKGWPYQLLPFECMAVVASIAAMALSSKNFRAKPLHFAVLALVPAVLLTRAAYFGRYDNGFVDVFGEMLEKERADWRGRSILLLSTDNYAAFPLINKLGSNWSGRYPYQWVIAGAITRQDQEGCVDTPQTCPRLNEILDYGRRTNVDDVVSQSPDVVIVDARPNKAYFPLLKFDYIDFLKQDPRFDAKWREYKKVATELNYDIWERDTATRASNEPAATDPAKPAL